jgi:ATP synthase protein I
MTQQHPPPLQPRGGDPWHAVGYLVSGVCIYGLLGWLADRWLGTSFLVAVGIIVGAAAGLYMTWNRFNRVEPDDRKNE